MGAQNYPSGSFPCAKAKLFCLSQITSINELSDAAFLILSQFVSRGKTKGKKWLSGGCSSMDSSIYNIIAISPSGASTGSCQCTQFCECPHPL